MYMISALNELITQFVGQYVPYMVKFVFYPCNLSMSIGYGGVCLLFNCSVLFLASEKCV